MNEVPLKQKETPLLKAKIRCICTKKLEPGEIDEEKNETNRKDPSGESLQAILSENSATH